MHRMANRHIPNAPAWRFLLFLAAAVAWAPGCGSEPPPGKITGDPTVKERQERDKAFRSSPQSPIPPQERGRFRGLDYFPVNPLLRYKVRLNRYPVPERVRLATNTGEIRDGLRYGYFEFSVDGTVQRLQVYRMDDSRNSGPPELFIPFMDATTSKESYRAGRYLDLTENTSGVYNLDFNLAYNPYCAYGGDYSCPIPPEENRLTVAIRAGEKAYVPSKQE
jgi:uncharacterized protein (DUF1684 family)